MVAQPLEAHLSAAIACESAEDRLGRRHAPEVDQRQHYRERTVDEGAVNDDVYVVEAILQDREAYGDRNPSVAQQNRIQQNIP